MAAEKRIAKTEEHSKGGTAMMFEQEFENEQEIKREYMNEIEKSSPDFEALWSEIEDKIDRQNEQTKTTEVKTAKAKKQIFRQLALVACVALFFVGYAVMRNDRLQSDGNNSVPDIDSSHDVHYDNMQSEDFLPSNQHDLVLTDAPSGDFPNNFPSDDASDNAHVSDAESSEIITVRYESLWLAPAEEVAADLSYDFSEYFVEEDVLKETAHIVEARVERVDITYDIIDGQKKTSLLYTVYVVGDYTGGFEEGELLFVMSTSPYQLLKGRQYILLLEDKTAGAAYHLAFENAPQIEVTLDGELVFHNGFRSMTEDSLYVEYPQAAIDDFYYDRMRYRNAKDIEPLLEMWKSVQ